MYCTLSLYSTWQLDIVFLFEDSLLNLKCSLIENYSPVYTSYYILQSIDDSIGYCYWYKQASRIVSNTKQTTVYDRQTT